MTLLTAVRPLLGLAFMLAASVAAQAEDYPRRPITLVITFAAGGFTDVSTRVMADVVSKQIGQSIVVENRPTGGGAVAATGVQNAAPDGYTLLVFAGSQLAVLPALGPVSYDPIKGFQPVSLLYSLVNFLAVPKDSPVESVRELFEHGKKKPGGLSFGSAGVGSPAHLNAAMIARSTQTPMEYVQYRGSAPMMADLVSGRLDFSLVSYTGVKPFLADGRLRILAVDATKRWHDMPDVPTMDEAGVPPARVGSWFALAAPAGTPASVVKKIGDAFAAAARDPEVIRRLTENGTVITLSSPDEMAALLAKEVEQTGALVRSLGLKTQ